MPSYTYRCSQCNNVFDIEATIQEKETVTSEKFTCPKCQSKEIQSEFSAGNFLKNIFQNDNPSGGCGCGGGSCGRD